MEGEVVDGQDQPIEAAPASESQATGEGQGATGAGRGVLSPTSIASRIDTLKPWAEALGLLAVLAIPITAIRVFVVANFDIPVALALVSSGSVSGLLIGAAVLSLPNLVQLVALALAIELGHPARRFSVPKIVAFLASLMYLSLMVRTWLELFVFICMPLLLMILLRIGDRKRDPGVVGHENRRLLLSFAASSTVILILSSTMWLPPERIVVNDRPQTMYVLAESDDGLIVFLGNANVVLRIANEDITDRQYCVPRGFLSFRRPSLHGRLLCPK